MVSTRSGFTLPVEKRKKRDKEKRKFHTLKNVGGNSALV